VLVASGALSFHAATTATLRLRLTAGGRRLLSAARRARLSASCLFTPEAAPPVSATATVELKR
jgi:hypothetical protein